MNRETLCLELRHLLNRLEEIDSDIKSERPVSEAEYLEILDRIRQVTRLLEREGI